MRISRSPRPSISHGAMRLSLFWRESRCTRASWREAGKPTCEGCQKKHPPPCKSGWDNTSWQAADALGKALVNRLNGAGQPAGKAGAAVDTPAVGPSKAKGKGKERRCGRCGHYHSGVCRTPESQLRAPSSPQRLTEHQMDALAHAFLAAVNERPQDGGVGLGKFLAHVLDSGAPQGKGKGKRLAEDPAEQSTKGSQDGPDKKKKKGSGGSGRTSCTPPNPGRWDRKDPPPGRGTSSVSSAYARR